MTTVYDRHIWTVRMYGQIKSTHHSLAEAHREAVRCDRIIGNCYTVVHEYSGTEYYILYDYALRPRNGNGRDIPFRY